MLRTSFTLTPSTTNLACAGKAAVCVVWPIEMILACKFGIAQMMSDRSASKWLLYISKLLSISFIYKNRCKISAFFVWGNISMEIMVEWIFFALKAKPGNKCVQRGFWGLPRGPQLQIFTLKLDREFGTSLIKDCCAYRHRWVKISCEPISVCLAAFRDLWERTARSGQRSSSDAARCKLSTETSIVCDQREAGHSIESVYSNRMTSFLILTGAQLRSCPINQAIEGVVK